jgi:hypothetical protein
LAPILLGGIVAASAEPELVKRLFDVPEWVARLAAIGVSAFCALYVLGSWLHFKPWRIGTFEPDHRGSRSGPSARRCPDPAIGCRRHHLLRSARNRNSGFFVVLAFWLVFRRAPVPRARRAWRAGVHFRQGHADMPAADVIAALRCSGSSTCWISLVFAIVVVVIRVRTPRQLSAVLKRRAQAPDRHRGVTAPRGCPGSGDAARGAPARLVHPVPLRRNRRARGLSGAGAAVRGPRAAMRAVLEDVAEWALALKAIDGADCVVARFDQDWFPTLDAAVAYAIVRRCAPARIVEIGSGHSTRFMALRGPRWPGHVHDLHRPSAPRHHRQARRAPHRERAGQGRSRAHGEPCPGDILFIDFSHIAMPGTDVDRLVLDTLPPRLACGVKVHIHDIFLPDTYPADWAWRGYNEQLVIGALLQGGAWEIVCANRWLETLSAGLAHRDRGAPSHRRRAVDSFWLRKR